MSLAETFLATINEASSSEEVYSALKEAGISDEMSLILKGMTASHYCQF